MAIAPRDLEKLADPLISLALKAGAEMLRLRAAGLSIEKKSDNSVVTNADKAIDAMLQKEVAAFLPGTAIISEESFDPARHKSQQAGTYWCIDPLDSTKDYVEGGGNFSINIALIREHRPILGMIHLPAKNAAFVGIPGLGCFRTENGLKQKVEMRPVPAQGLDVVVSSRSHGSLERLTTHIKSHPIHSVERMNGSYKFCLLAEGRADLYPRFTQIWEWDIAAGDAIIEAAEGRVTDFAGQPLAYGKYADFICPEFLARHKDF